MIAGKISFSTTARYHNGYRHCYGMSLFNVDFHLLLGRARANSSSNISFLIFFHSSMLYQIQLFKVVPIKLHSYPFRFVFCGYNIAGRGFYRSRLCLSPLKSKERKKVNIQTSSLHSWSIAHMIVNFANFIS